MSARAERTMNRREPGERDSIVVERDGAVGWIRINRPERLNAFAGDMRERLLDALRVHERDRAVHCVVVIGAGRAFSTGGDIRYMAELVEAEDAAAFEKLVRAGADVVTQIDGMSTPVIAAINGPAAGAGACLALACDIRLASETASIGLTFARVGLHADWGGTYFLPRLCGPALAAELLLTGGMISAERAERVGLVNRVVPADDLENAARVLAGQIAAGPAETLAATKRALRRSLNAPLGEILEMETQAQLAAFRSPDFREGITAFIQKRTPRFGHE